MSQQLHRLESMTVMRGRSQVVRFTPGNPDSAAKIHLFSVTSLEVRQSRMISPLSASQIPISWV